METLYFPECSRMVVVIAVRVSKSSGSAVPLSRNRVARTHRYLPFRLIPRRVAPIYHSYILLSILGLFHFDFKNLTIRCFVKLLTFQMKRVITCVFANRRRERGKGAVVAGRQVGRSKQLGRLSSRVAGIACKYKRNLET